MKSGSNYKKLFLLNFETNKFCLVELHIWDFLQSIWLIFQIQWDFCMYFQPILFDIWFKSWLFDIIITQTGRAISTFPDKLRLVLGVRQHKQCQFYRRDLCGCHYYIEPQNLQEPDFILKFWVVMENVGGGMAASSKSFFGPIWLSRWLE